MRPDTQPKRVAKLPADSIDHSDVEILEKRPVELGISGKILTNIKRQPKHYTNPTRYVKNKEAPQKQSD